MFRWNLHLVNTLHLNLLTDLLTFPLRPQWDIRPQQSLSTRSCPWLRPEPHPHDSPISLSSAITVCRHVIFGRPRFLFPTSLAAANLSVSFIRTLLTQKHFKLYYRNNFHMKQIHIETEYNHIPSKIQCIYSENPCDVTDLQK